MLIRDLKIIYTAFLGKSHQLNWYKEIRKYNDIDNLRLEIIESLPDSITIKQLRKHEDYWIKYYWNKIGKDMMYNSQSGNTNIKNMLSKKSIEKSRLTKEKKYGNKNYNLHCKKSRLKTRLTMHSKYGDQYAQLRTPEAREHAVESQKRKNNGKLPMHNKEVFEKRKEKYGSVMGQCLTLEAKEKRRISVSHKFIFKGKICIGLIELRDTINSYGYNFSVRVVQKLALYNEFSKENRLKYPELIGSITVIK